MPKILIMRHDNIGDLICVTPLLQVLHESIPDVELHAFVNSYNAPVLTASPLLKAVYAYTKAKHRTSNQSLLQVYWEKLSQLYALRAQRFDIVMLATPSPTKRLYQLAKWIAPKKILLLAPDSDEFAQEQQAWRIPRSASLEQWHEVERIYWIGQQAFCLEQTLPPPVKIYVAPEKRTWAWAQLHQYGAGKAEKKRVAIHISARKPSQRWPLEHIVVLLHELSQTHPLLEFVLFWSPGSETHPHHPGDDEKAQVILEGLKYLNIIPFATQTLDELIAGLSACDYLICSDGGAMHVGAGVGLPIVCFFGDSEVRRWHPWGVPHIVLQPEDKNVASLLPEQVIKAFNQLKTLI